MVIDCKSGDGIVTSIGNVHELSRRMYFDIRRAISLVVVLGKRGFGLPRFQQSRCSIEVVRRNAASLFVAAERNW